MRKKIEPEKWPDSGPLLECATNNFSQLIDCPEFVQGASLWFILYSITFLLEQTALSVGVFTPFTYLCKSLFRLRKLKII